MLEAQRVRPFRQDHGGKIMRSNPPTQRAMEIPHLAPRKCKEARLIAPGMKDSEAGRRKEGEN